MTEKEMIEELAHNLYCKQDEYNMSNPFEIAKCVIDLGYREIKIKDNDLYIPEEYIEELGNFIATSPQMKQTMEELIETWQKETVKEILQELLDFIHNETFRKGYELKKVERKIKEIAKIKGVEVEE